MSRLYVLASVPKQGKTTTALLLEKYFKSKGLKVACLQPTFKEQWDVGLYLKENCHLYGIPVEAAKSKKDFEKWLPIGYDIYLFELGFPYTFPASAAYITEFDNINEVILHDVKDCWKNFISKEYSLHGLQFWDEFYDRNVQRVLTKTPKALDMPCVDDKLGLHNVDEFVFNEVKPKMSLPKSNKEVVAVGAFPGEFQYIFNLKWYGYDYPSFVERYKKEDWDIAVVGACTNDKMRFKYRPRKHVFCYHPPIYVENLKYYSEVYAIKTDLREVYYKIKENPVGSPVGEKDCFFSSINNKYWTFQTFAGLDLISTLDGSDNIVICNG